MPSIRLVFLWHMHQPFYKDLWTGDPEVLRRVAEDDEFGILESP